MSSHDLQRLADRDGVRTYSVERGDASPWLVHLTYPAAEQQRVGADPEFPVCTPEWPCTVPRRPTAGDVLDEWFAVIAGRGPEQPPQEVVAALRQDVRHLLGERYEEYRHAARGPGGAAASGGCLVVLVGLLGAVCAGVTVSARQDAASRRDAARRR